MTWRRLALVAVVAALLTACSDSQLLDQLGERSHQYVQGTTTIPPVTTDPSGGENGIPLKDVARNVTWYNEGIETGPTFETAVVISAVWQRGNGQDRFIQASPREVSAALPGVQFLSLVPRTTQSITSQLVYDTASATLDAGVSAAFGLWSGDPYRAQDDQVGVLRIGQELTVRRRDGIRAIEVEDGINLLWTDGTYQYELFCHEVLAKSQCQRLARSVVPLEVIVGPGVPED
jgi:hypothetical protein